MEAHGTDYQRPGAFKDLVRDGFAIMKVGPALTFAQREALFALEEIEKCLAPELVRSQLRATPERMVLREPNIGRSTTRGYRNIRRSCAFIPTAIALNTIGMIRMCNEA